MSPRRNRPPRPGRGKRAVPTPPEPGRAGVDELETWRSQWWRVRRLAGAAAVKTYRCPGCDQEIRAGVPHVVVWPADGGEGADQVGAGRAGADQAGTDRVAAGVAWNPLGERRHWHTGCWRARDRRAPTR